MNNGLSVPGVEAEMGQDDKELLRILAIADEHGDEVLTDDEYALLLTISGPELPDPHENHHVNLAEYIDENELASIANDIILWTDADEQSRKDWQERENKGIRLLGVSDNTDAGAGFEGASTAVHPLLAEACVQFQARAMEAMWPAEGPVKTIVLGEIDEEVTEQSRRVQDFMNYQYTQMMPGAFEDTDRMLFRLPLSGSAFKKMYYDPLEQTVVSKYVDAQYMLVPYGATSLRDAPRYTHVQPMAKNDMRRLQISGFYRDIDIGEPSAAGPDVNKETTDEIDETQGSSDTLLDDDQRYTPLECHCYYDLCGFEDKDECGNNTGLALPYIITVDKDSQKVLSIRRNWRNSDVERRKRVHFSHYRFLPGLGFYGYGFLHIIGGLGRAATGALRAMLDSAAFSNMQGGFMSKDAKISRTKEPLAPGEWRETDSTAEELSKAFFRVPYHEPSTALFQLLGYLDNIGRRFAGTTEAVVGEASNSGPVGTTLALIEQGLKVFSGIHKRLHQAAGEEFKLVAQLNFEFLPDDGYPYKVEGKDNDIFYRDFDGRVDVIPVSDPNIVTSTQRIAQAQSVLQLAGQAPGLYDQRAAHRRMLEALRIQDIDELMPEKGQAERAGPVEESMAVMGGKPIKAYPDQNHQAHIAVHQAQLGMLPSDIRKRVEPAVMAHIQEHLAFAFMLQLQQAAGMQFPMAQEGQEISPEMENQIAVMAAQAAQSLMPQQQPEADPKALEAQASVNRKDRESTATIQRKDAEAAANIRRKDADWLADKQRDLRDQEAALLQQHGLNGVPA